MANSLDMMSGMQVDILRADILCLVIATHSSKIALHVFAACVGENMGFYQF